MTEKQFIYIVYDGSEYFFHNTIIGAFTTEEAAYKKANESVNWEVEKVEVIG